MSITSWTASHPLRAQVNARLNNQNARIQAGVASGQLTPTQAQGLHQQDQFIRSEERNMASANGGHITGAQQTALNQQLSSNSQQIGPAAPPTPTLPSPPAAGGLTSDPTNNVITTWDGSTIKPDATGDGFTYTDAKTGQSTTFGGDPHVYEGADGTSGDATFSVQGPFQLKLNDGSVINVQTTPPDANGATVISGIDVIGPGNHRATMSGLDTGQVATSGVTPDGASSRGELGSSVPVLSNRGSIGGQRLGGADWTAVDPSDGIRKEITGGGDSSSWTYGNPVDP